MSNTDEFDFEDAGEQNQSGSGEQGPKALRDAYDKQKQELDALRKEMGDLRAAGRKRSIEDALRNAEAPTRLAKYAERDIEGDVSDEAVLKWLTENGQDFGWEAPDSEPDPDAQEAQRMGDTIANARQPVVGDAALLHTLQTADYKTLIERGLIPSFQ